MVNIKGVLDFLDRVTDMAVAAAPIAASLGIPLIKQVAGLADTAVDVAKNALDRVDDVKAGHASENEGNIKARIAKLDAANAELHQYILNS